MPFSFALLSAEAINSAVDALENTPIDNGFVVLMGIGTVFVGLVCIVLLVKLMSMVAAIATPASASAKATVSAPATAPYVPAVTSTVTENRAEIVAAVCAAVAEELGTDVNALRVVSFKKIS